MTIETILNVAAATAGLLLFVLAIHGRPVEHRSRGARAAIGVTALLLIAVFVLLVESARRRQQELWSKLWEVTTQVAAKQQATGPSARPQPATPSSSDSSLVVAQPQPVASTRAETFLATTTPVDMTVKDTETTGAPNQAPDVQMPTLSPPANVHEIDVRSTAAATPSQASIDPAPQPSSGTRRQATVDPLVPQPSSGTRRQATVDPLVPQPSSGTTDQPRRALATSAPTVMSQPQTYENEPLAAFIGEWRGRVSQRWAPAYTVVLSLYAGNIGDVIGKVEYPEINCGGRLKLVEVTAGHLRVAEQLSFGVNKCVGGGVISVDLEGPRKARWAWSDGIPRHSATASLMRE